MKKNIAFLMVMTVLILPAAAMAQATLPASPENSYGFKPKNWEVTLQGAGTSENDFDNTVFNIQAGLGYFLTKDIEAGLRQGFERVDPLDGKARWSGSTRLFADYNFDLWMFRPFAGVNFGYLYGHRVNDSWIGGVEGGIKVFLRPSTFIYGLLEYNHTFNDDDNSQDSFDDGRWVYALGFGITF